MSYNPIMEAIMLNFNHFYTARVITGFSLAHAATSAGISRSMLYLYEQYPNSRVPVLIVCKLASCYQMSPDQLLSITRPQMFLSSYLYLSLCNHTNEKPVWIRRNILGAYRAVHYCMSADAIKDAYGSLNYHSRYLITTLLQNMLGNES